MKRWLPYLLIVVASFAIAALLHFIIHEEWETGIQSKGDSVVYLVSFFFFAVVNCLNYYQWKERRKKKNQTNKNK